MRQVLAFRRTLDENRRASTCYLFLARTLMLENKQDDVIATFRTGLKLKPGMTVARCDLATVLFSTGRCREAETELETGLAHDATEPELHCPLAMDAAMQGQYLRAGQQCAEALRLAPDLPSVHVELAEILAAQHKTAGRSPSTSGTSNSGPTFPTPEQLGVGTRHQRGPPVPQRRRGGEHGRLRLRADS
jgi:cytochrome c-type biogenesis protein CcmH/NrfG